MKKHQPDVLFSSSKTTAHVFPVRNIFAAFAKATKEQYPDKLGVMLWTNKKGARPQIVEMQILRKIVAHLNTLDTTPTSCIRIKLTPSTGGLTLVEVGTGANTTAIHHVDK